MVIVDVALAQRLQQGNPVRVGMVGAGYMARGIALQILTAMPGLRLVAISNRTVAHAERAYRDAGVVELAHIDSAAELEAAIAASQYAVTDDPFAICRAGPVEAVIETTGDVEFGARVALEAIRNGKHVILMNAEVDASIGPILKRYADRAGVVYTYSDGDEPGVAMNLFRFVDSMGYKPVLMGQIKGFLDRYRNPETQKAFAETHQQKPAMVASFADGSKLALESAIMGNATGFVPAVRGMYGYACAHVKDLLTKFSVDDFKNGGLVDFVLGAEPHTGAFVMAYNDHPMKRQYMRYFKFGDGPLYLFYTPYHLPHMQLPHSVARAVLFHDATLAPRGAPVCDTIAVAKRDLKAGERLDGMGGFTCYGLVDTYENCRRGDFLPMALSVDCRLRRDIAKDQPIRYADVELPVGRLCDQLRAEQTAVFSAQAGAV
ncbi:MAG: NAD(P)-dependent oxidoreductase [Sutterellaceae bacterium]|nr:NAD(P)-dependent oxidoreductase [Burkholderiaceae bacterium]MCX7901111.1 NAD(P)-dependent oxidoreductase [Burkholderiaceae bacterium]MDW8430976.1 NAD(P)-dependent oxidoreductase [Sutterellaceae bacterium]